MNKKILIIVGGNVNKLDKFIEPISNLKLNVTLASFSDLSYSNVSVNNFQLFVNDIDVKEFDLVYIRMIGKRLEDASILVNYAKENNIKIIDSVYENSFLIPSSISKAVEMKKLIQNNVLFPKTFYGNLNVILEKAEKEFGYPFIVKSTSGRKARDVWSPKNREEMLELKKELVQREKRGDRFFSQVFLKASQRLRAFVVGDEVVAVITRPTKYRKRVLEKNEAGDFPASQKGLVYPIPDEYKNLALSAAKAANLDIAGVDIMHEDNSDQMFVIEVNAAPSWKLVAKDANICVEEKILQFLNEEH